MQSAIDKGKLSYIRSHIDEASLSDLYYAYEKNMDACWLIFSNQKIKHMLYLRCGEKLGLDEVEFLGFRGEDPRRIANTIKELVE
jgi:hypothetical protein